MNIQNFEKRLSTIENRITEIERKVRILIESIAYSKQNQNTQNNFTPPESGYF